MLGGRLAVGFSIYALGGQKKRIVDTTLSTHNVYFSLRHTNIDILSGSLKISQTTWADP